MRSGNRPVPLVVVFATVYPNLGIDVNSTTVIDAMGRPHYVVEPGTQTIHELA